MKSPESLRSWFALLAPGTYRIALQRRIGGAWRTVDEQETTVEPGAELDILLRGP